MITKELRKYAWDKVPSKHLEDLIDIADAIEQKHEEELAKQRESVRCEIADKFDGWVVPPKDADGDSIHLGDVLEWQGASFTVEVLEIDEEGWWTRHDGFSVKCSDARHAQPDSWEAIIEAAVDYGDKRLYTGTKGDKANIAELVERCKRLAGEDA